MRPVLPDDPARLRAWRDATLYRLVTARVGGRDAGER